MVFELIFLRLAICILRVIGNSNVESPNHLGEQRF